MLMTQIQYDEVERYLQQSSMNNNSSMKVTDLAKTQVTDNKKMSVWRNLWEISSGNTSKLINTIIGDFNYKPKNTYSFSQKQKILSYLQTKCLNSYSQIQLQTNTKFNSYDLQFYLKKGLNFRDIILKGKTNLQALQNSIQLLQKSKTQIKARFLNEAAYEFDRQRYCSIGWGLLIAAFINATIYRKAVTARKAALFLFMGHMFGQLSYHYNIDHYFDSVYSIYEVQAIKYMLQEKSKENNLVLGGKTQFIED